MATLVLLAAAASAAPSAATPSRSPTQEPARGLTAEQAMAHYHMLIRGAVDPHPADCLPNADGQIMVCGRAIRPAPRLPAPDERAELGEVVHHPSEPPRPGDAGDYRQCNHNCEPSKLGETIGKGIGLLKSLFTGEDPVD